MRALTLLLVLALILEDSSRGQGDVSRKKAISARDDVADVDSGRSSNGASNVAQKAAEEAKAASDAQVVAGREAARQVKVQLADKAIQAAKAASAALAGKAATVGQLQREMEEAETVVQEESTSLRRAQANADAAERAAKQAGQQLKTLTQAAQMANVHLGNAKTTAVGAQRELDEKERLLQEARNRVDELQKRMRCAANELTKTKVAAAKAADAARRAKANANRNKRARIASEKR